MTVSAVHNVCAPRIVPESALKGLGNGIHLLEVLNREGAVPSPSAPCRSTYTPGKYQQRAHADAISPSHDVLIAARDAESDPGKRAALDKSLGHIGPTPQEAYGPRVMNKLTVWGAVLKAVEHALERAPGNKDLVACRNDLKSAIVKVGLRAGVCKGIADGGYHGDKLSRRLCEAMEQGQDVVLTCRQVMGDSDLLDGIVSAVLPSAMMQSFVERQPKVAASYEGRMQELDLAQFLHKPNADATWSAVEHQMQTGCPEAFSTAVFNLLKLPEYVMEGVPAGPGAEQPTATPVPDSKFPPIPAMPSAGNQAINQNYVDNSGFGKAFSDLAGKLGSVSNLTLKDAVALGMDLARAEEQNKFLKDEIVGLRTRNTDLRNENAGLRDENAGLRNENKDLRIRLEDLDRKFDQIQERLNGWGSHPPRFETKDDASTGTDSGRGSIFYGGHINLPTINTDYSLNDADLNTDTRVLGSVPTQRAEAAVGTQEGNDPETDELLERLQALRGVSSKRGLGADLRSPAMEGALQSSANLTAQAVNDAGNLASGQQAVDPVEAPVVALEHLQASANTRRDVADGVRRGQLDDRAAEAIEQIEVDEIVFAGLEKELKALRERRIQERAEGQNVSATSGDSRYPGAGRPEFRRSDSVRSVRELIRQFDAAARSSRSSSVEADESVDGRTISEHLAPEQQVFPAIKSLASVELSAIRGPLTGIREEFDALRGFRSDQGHALSAVKNGDPFREYFKSIGGLSFSPPVPPAARNRQVARSLSELEQVNAKLAENREQDSPRLLKDVFPQKTPYGRTMRELVDSVGPALHSNPIFVSGDAGESAATLPVGTGPDDSPMPRATEPHAQATKKLFERVDDDYLARRFAPKVLGLEAVS